MRIIRYFTFVSGRRVGISATKVGIYHNYKRLKREHGHKKVRMKKIDVVRLYKNSHDDYADFVLGKRNIGMFRRK